MILMQIIFKIWYKNIKSQNKWVTSVVLLMGYMQLYCRVTNHLSYFNMHPHNILYYDSCNIFNAFTLPKTNTNLILKKTKQN
jgi:hypothetical protein